MSSTKTDSGKRSRAQEAELRDPENGEDGSPDDETAQASKARRLRARRAPAKLSQSASQKNGKPMWSCSGRHFPNGSLTELQ